MIVYLFAFIFLAVQVTPAQHFSNQESPLQYQCSSTFNYNLLYLQERPSSSSSIFQFQTGLNAELQFFPTLKTNFFFKSFDDKASFINSLTPIKIEATLAHKEVGIDVLFKFQGITINGVIGTCYTPSGTDLLYDIRTTFSRGSAHEFELGFSHTPQILSLTADYLNNTMRLNYVSTRDRFLTSLKLNPFKNLIVHAELISSLSNSNPKYGSFTATDDPKTQEWYGAIQYKKHRLKYFLNYERLDEKNAITMENNSLSFGYMNIPGFTKEQFHCGIVSTTAYFDSLTVSLGYFKYTASAVGNIQSWPFTDIFLSVIANRINLRGHASLYGTELAYTQSFSFKSFKIRPAAVVRNVIPDFVIESWQPSFLVFGVKDYKKTTYDIKRAVLLTVGVDVDYNFKSFVLNAGIDQLVPVYIKKEEVPQPTVPPTPGKPVKVKTDGGRFMRLMIRYFF